MYVIGKGMDGWNEGAYGSAAGPAAPVCVFAMNFDGTAGTNGGWAFALAAAAFFPALGRCSARCSALLLLAASLSLSLALLSSPGAGSPLPAAPGAGSGRPGRAPLCMCQPPKIFDRNTFSSRSAWLWCGSSTDAAALAAVGEEEEEEDGEEEDEEEGAGCGEEAGAGAGAGGAGTVAPERAAALLSSCGTKSYMGG